MAWQEVGGAVTGGANVPIGPNNWLGTRNAAPLIIRTENNSPAPMAGTEVLRFTPAADGRRVGIGTITPQRKLHVEPSEIHSGGSGAGFSFGNRETPDPFAVPVPNNGERWVWYASGGTARLWSFTDKITVTSAGRVGIGTPTPQVKLDVDGGAIRGIGPSGQPGVIGNGFIGVAGSGLQSNGIGVMGDAHFGSVAIGVWGLSNSGFAGYFSGPVHVSGQINKAALAFQIDHLLDPENKYLLHSGVESPDMKNVYDGIAQLNEDGSAWIELPEWFGELNRDCRYQLTPIGGPAPDLHIAEEISENRVRIAGGTAGMDVSWQVTGIRKDPWAEMNRIVVEQDKPEEARGTYLHPEAFGQPETRGEDYARLEGIREALPPDVDEKRNDST